MYTYALPKVELQIMNWLMCTQLILHKSRLFMIISCSLSWLWWINSYIKQLGCVWKWLVSLNPMVLLISIPMKNGYFIGNINPTFSDKPTSSWSLSIVWGAPRFWLALRDWLWPWPLPVGPAAVSCCAPQGRHRQAQPWRTVRQVLWELGKSH